MLRRILLIVLLFAFATQAHAQIPDSLTERLIIDISPEFPVANEAVFLTVRSVSLDLDRADIAWYANDELITSGPGQRGATVVLGSLGSKTLVSVSVISEDDNLFTAERTLRPADADLLWESDSYVHPFYAGKRLPSSGSLVRAEVVARLFREDGARLQPKDIMYTWYRNGAIVTSASGRGRSAAQFSAPDFLGEDTITVEAASVDDTLIAAASARIPSVSPFVALYQDHPLFGILYHAGIPSSFTLPDIEATFAAIPYFASITGPNDTGLVYDWRVNGARITPDEADPSRLTINAENSDGNARTEVSITHRRDYLMDARNAWNLVFNGGTELIGTGLFGTPQ